jgi:aryl-alcohol dehydrogenase-like predicted oxidoreductase
MRHAKNVLHDTRLVRIEVTFPRSVGDSFLFVSEFALGAMTFGMPGWGCDEETASRLLHRYLDAKVGLPVGAGHHDRGASRVHVKAACEKSLRHLQTDHIDLYQIHVDDEATPLAGRSLIPHPPTEGEGLHETHDNLTVSCSSS